MDTIAKKQWLMNHGYISWHGFADGKATGGQWNSHGRGDNAVVISIKGDGSEAIILAMFNIVKKHLFTRSGGVSDDE